MSSLLTAIDFDVESLRYYFRKLFAFVEETELAKESASAGPEFDATLEREVAQFVRPDMLSNVYGLVDFWLAELARIHKAKRNLTLAVRDLRGDNDLDRYHKYFTKVVALNLEATAPSYRHLDDLRVVRNCFLHGGGHMSPGTEERFKRIEGIKTFGSLVRVGDSFVWSSLEHANSYIFAVAENAKEC